MAPLFVKWSRQTAGPLTLMMVVNLSLGLQPGLGKLLGRWPWGDEFVSLLTLRVDPKSATSKRVRTGKRVKTGQKPEEKVNENPSLTRRVTFFYNL